jgi:hypothetical protein
MVEEQLAQNPVNELLAEFGTRLNEVEEKQRLLRDRALLIGENLILIKEEFEKQNFELKQHLQTHKEELKEIKKILNRIVVELPNFARKSELEILENQSKMFQPLELARISDVERIINKKINKNEK